VKKRKSTNLNIPMFEPRTYNDDELMEIIRKVLDDFRTRTCKNCEYKRNNSHHSDWCGKFGFIIAKDFKGCTEFKRNYYDK